jgi:hypothetical protein
MTQMWHLGIHSLDGLSYFKKNLKCLKYDNQHVNLTTFSGSHVNMMHVSFQILAYVHVEFARNFNLTLFLLGFFFFLDLNMMVLTSFVPFMLKRAKPACIV